MKHRVTSIFWQKLQNTLEWSCWVRNLIVIFWCNIWERVIVNLHNWVGATLAVMLGVWCSICCMFWSFTLLLFFQTCIVQESLATFLFSDLPLETKCFVCACIETLDPSMLKFTLSRSQLEGSSKVVNIPLVSKNYLLYCNKVLREDSHREHGACKWGGWKLFEMTSFLFLTSGCHFYHITVATASRAVCISPRG